ncbi:uncharacterized protein PFL1_02851 [Pseudozyma flocculosa PF-1]|uniref:Related to Ral2 protein, implicated in activation of ras1 n=2 Tax=Pseudozyma flocculosa TaxID=84751 RepID=A0A5C3F2S1_9BASI|nr:uncharacterized protein PFL1_02851 [Pseudozyma flocculosa PF-1]EPQ29632.1 hypothetical protein PFL1_02851 [Pseudozyma flocculosa PF-1]SPO38196.1 related to Ral2 protein, implicated in activation of ras1 [Pseudozyma flocculosa]
MHPSIINLSSRLHLCSGEIPPPLVGASATLVEPSSDVEDRTPRMYLFGGRLVSNRRMINHLYCLDLERMVWTRISPSSAAESSSSASASVDSAAAASEPQPRYFHSADLWNNKIIIFGGMGYSTAPDASRSPQEVKNDDLCVLDEVLAFDLASQTWDLSFSPSALDYAEPSASHLQAKPAPRYAHLSSISDDSLIIVGGQNMTNQYVESINVFSLTQRRWISAQRFQRQCGSYRSLAVAARYNSHEGEKAKCYPRSRDPLVRGSAEDGEDSGVEDSAAANGSHGESTSSPLPKVDINPLPVSSIPTAKDPQPIYVYSNYNFTDVRRELEVLRLQPDVLSAMERQPTRRGSVASEESAIDVEMPISPSRPEGGPNDASGDLVAIEENSSRMTGSTLPPGLRFPTGAILGSFLIISGTYLANATQTFSLWALHLPTMTWSRIEAGSHLSTGSWNRAILWPGKNRMIVVGHKERDLVSDYNHRQTNWNHVVVLELEAWGIYQPPVPRLSRDAVELGLRKLAASSASSMTLNAGFKGLSLEQNDAGEDEKSALPWLSDSFGGRGDFEIVCSDGIRIGCDRAILEKRWPWFQSKMDDFRRRARRTARVVVNGAGQQESNGLGLIPEELSDILAEDDSTEEQADVDGVAAAREALEGGAAGPRRARDPRFQPRHLQLSEPSAIVMAFLQFIYTEQICTALQRHPAVVCALLVLSKTYRMDDLLTWAKHAAHVALADDLNPKSPSTAGASSAAAPESGGLELFRPSDSLGLHPEERHRLAVCLYEAASLCGCEGLQVRALRVVMSVARWLQKHGSSGGGGAGPGSSGLGSNDRYSGHNDGAGSSSRSSSMPGSASGFSGAGGGNDSSSSYNHSQRGGYPQASTSATPVHQDSPAISDSPSVAAGQPGPALRGPSPRDDADPSRLGPADPTRLRPLPSTGLGITHQETGMSAPAEDGPAPASPAEAVPRARHPVPGVGYDRYSMAEDDLLDSFGLAPPATDRSRFGSRFKMSLSRSGSLKRGSSSPYSASSPSLDTDSSAPSFPGFRNGAYHNGSSPTSTDFSRAQTGTSISSAASDSQHSLSQGSMSDAASRPHQASSSSGDYAGPSPAEHPAEITVATLATRYPHLSIKELKKLEKEEKKRIEREQKARKKAERAEFKRLAAEAVFGPKGSDGPSQAPMFDDSESEYTTSNGSTLQTESSAGRSEGLTSRTSSIRSGTSTASPRTAASLKTNKSPRSPKTPEENPAWLGGGSYTGAWFAGGPSPLMGPPLQSARYARGSKSSRSVGSGGRHSTSGRA